jgi:toxin ParE1/3/4
MITVRQSKKATADLVHIWRSINRESPRSANKVAADLRSKIEQLADIPEMGVKREELGRSMRMIVVDSYLIFYTFEIDTVNIRRVLHGARDLKRVMRGGE